MKVPFSPPDISDAEINEVCETLRSGWITTGPRTKEFERRIAERCRADRAVALSSATAAMELVLRMLGIGEGDEVITTAYTYTATCSVICHVGATPVIVDTAEGSFYPEPEVIAEHITKKTKVIMPVDIGGRMFDYAALYRAIEPKKGLYSPSTPLQRCFDHPIILADAAHSFGSVEHGIHSGSAADFTTFSFHAVKNLTTAEGGAVAWKHNEALDSDKLYRDFCLMGLHGQSKDALAKIQAGAWEYDVLYPAYKCNMTDIQAAIGLVQLDRFDSLIARRRELVARYDAALKPLGILTLDHLEEGNASNCHLYLTRIPSCPLKRRSGIITRMAEKGVAANVHFKPLPLLTAYRDLGFDIKDYPNAYAQYSNEITLPLHTKLTNEQADFVIQSFIEAQAEV